MEEQMLINTILGRWNSLNKAYMGYLGKDEIL